MNQELYQQLKEAIQAKSYMEMAHLDALGRYFGVLDNKTPLKSIQMPLKLDKKPEMKLLKEMPSNGVIATQISPEREPTQYIGKLQRCEIKDCLRKTKPERRCPSCSKRVCTRHLRGKVCKECNAFGEK